MGIAWKEFGQHISYVGEAYMTAAGMGLSKARLGRHTALSRPEE